MIVFPHDEDGGLTLAGEVLELYKTGAFSLQIGQAVVDELDEVVDGRFPRFRAEMAGVLRPFANQFVRWPIPAEIAAVLPHCTDPFDAPIFASALLSKADIVLSNDFRAFHTPKAKVFWGNHHLTVESLYGLLCVFGLRERRGE
jgi:hypothetical protein